MKFWGNLKIEDCKSSLSNKLPTKKVDIFFNENCHNTGNDLTIEYFQNGVKILDCFMNDSVALSLKECGLNSLHYVSLTGYSYYFWLMISGFSLDTIQDKQMLDDFIEAKRGGLCGIMGDRFINSSINNRNIWYIDVNNLYAWAMMQKLPYKDFMYSTASLDDILYTTDDSDHGYYIVCDVDYNDIC